MHERTSMPMLPQLLPPALILSWAELYTDEQCFQVTVWNNQTYPKDSSAPEWSVTWEYPPGPEDAPVHAFPNVKIDSGVFPSSIKDIKEISLDFEWTYTVGNSTAETVTDESELEAASVNANVALDMFLDKDKKKAQDSEKASTEIMVWFAAFGSATQPIGFKKELGTEKLDGTTLYESFPRFMVSVSMLTYTLALSIPGRMASAKTSSRGTPRNLRISSMGISAPW